MRVEWKTCLRIGISIFLLYLCITYWSGVTAVLNLMLGAAMPLLIGGVIAYLVNILMSFYEKHFFVKSKSAAAVKCRRPICMIGAFLTLIAVVVLVIALIVPQLWSCVEVILAGVPGVLKDAVDFIERYEMLPEDIVATLENIDWRSWLGEILQVVTSKLGNVVDVLITTVTSVFSWLVSLLMSFIFAIYLLLGKERLGRQYHRLVRHFLSEKWLKRLDYVLEIVNDSFRGYIVGQCTEALIIGVLCTLGMLIFRLPYATMIGALIGFTALIPVAGAYIGAFVGAFMILTVSPWKAVMFLVFIVVLQQLEDNIVYPKVVGSSLGLPGIWVLAAVTIGGGVMGIPGMLIGVPLVSAAYRLMRDELERPPRGGAGKEKK